MPVTALFAVSRSRARDAAAIASPGQSEIASCIYRIKINAKLFCPENIRLRSSAILKSSDEAEKIIVMQRRILTLAIEFERRNTSERSLSTLRIL